MPLSNAIRHISILDSHTGGEPTRIVLSGAPDLGAGTLSSRMQILQRDHDSFRTAVVNEPRGSDVLVGALLCQPVDPTCAAGVIFFNNVGYLGMCGHGTIGLIVSLAHLGRIQPGTHRIETTVGIVTATLHPSGKVTVENVPSYRTAASVAVSVPGYGTVTGDIAWGGNWFYLVEHHGKALTLENVDPLTDYTWAIREALAAQSITGPNGELIDHIELFTPSPDPTANSTNFVLCPGKAYDRSPCGTGTSAKLACLFADGKLAPGETWIQRGILGSSFEGSFRVHGIEGIEGDTIIPSITGAAHIMAEATLLLDPDDPFCMGIAK